MTAVVGKSNSHGHTVMVTTFNSTWGYIFHCEIQVLRKNGRLSINRLSIDEFIDNLHPCVASDRVFSCLHNETADISAEVLCSRTPCRAGVALPSGAFSAAAVVNATTAKFWVAGLNLRHQMVLSVY